LNGTDDITTVDVEATHDHDAIGLMVYNTNTTSSGTNDVSPGFYYWNGAKWMKISVIDDFEDEIDPTWTGDANITSDIGRVGNIGIGTETPEVKLHVADDGAILATGVFDNEGWDGGELGEGSRMMWIPEKAAFRVGYVENENWDSDSIGNYSIGLGRSVKALGSHSVAAGYLAEATAHGSVAMGLGSRATGTSSFSAGTACESSGDFSTSFGLTSIASGHGSTAIGYVTNASGRRATAIGHITTASGNRSTALGSYTRAEGSYSFSAGRYTHAEHDSTFVFGFGIDADDRFTSPKKKTFSVGINKGNTDEPDFMVEEGRVGINTANPRTSLEISGDGAILATGTYGEGWEEPNIGGGTRMMWIPRKAAFRVGGTTGGEWDSANIGDYSFAATWNAIASGSGAVAIGPGAEATGDTSVALGNEVEATNNNATVIGVLSRATGSASTAIGNNLEASGSNSLAMGNITKATALHSVAVGYLLEANHANSIVFGVGQAMNAFTSPKEKSFSVAFLKGAGDDPDFMVEENRVGIGTSNPQHPLHVGIANGAHVTTGGDWINGSDIRFKTDILSIKYGLNEIMSLNPVNYTHKNAGTKQIGFIAQEMKEIIPEVVSGEEGDIEKGETLGISYGSLVSLLTKGMQEQQEIIDNQKNTIKNLEERIINQEERYQDLIKRIEMLEDN